MATLLKMDCNSYGLCIDPASPLSNISAADEDQLLFLQNWWGPNQAPPLGSHFTLTVCTGVCEAENQIDLLSCVVTKAIECAADDSWNPIPISPPGGGYGNDPTPPIPPSNPVGVFYNQPLLGTSLCEDGSTFTLEYPAGLAAGFSMAQADANGQGLADQAAIAAMFCLADIDPLCLGEEIDITIGDQGTLTVDAGGLPIGIDISGTHITGTPTVGGDYVVSLKLAATIDGYSCYCIRTYTINVIGFTSPATLPDATIGVPYSYQLLYDAVSANPTFELVGSLPSGLSLNTSTGLISGTPT